MAELTAEPTSLSLGECQRSCTQRPGARACTGIVVSGSGVQRVNEGSQLAEKALLPAERQQAALLDGDAVVDCWLRTGAIEVSKCQHDQSFMTLTWRHPPLPPPPPRPPLPPRSPRLSPQVGTETVLAGINGRFIDGEPSNDYIEAGVFIHQSDTIWACEIPPCAPLTSGGDFAGLLAAAEQTTWAPLASGPYADRMVGSVLNKNQPFTFSSSAVGIILDPRHMTDRLIRCACESP